MLKAIVVEDEYLAREELAYLIRTHGSIEIIASFEDGLEAFKFCRITRWIWCFSTSRSRPLMG